MRTAEFALAFAFSASSAGEPLDAAPPERLVVKASRIVPSPGKSIPRGVLVIEGGKIAAIGTDLGVPKGARVLDYGDAVVCAGFVNCHTAAGIDGAVTDTTEAFTPAICAADAVERRRRGFDRAAAVGVTTIGFSPDGRNVVGGTAALVKTGPEASVVRREAYLKISLSNAAFDSERFPTSLAGGLGALNRAWKEAGSDPARVKEPGAKILARARAAKGLRPWIEAGDPAVARQVIAMAKDLGFSPVVVAAGDLTEAASELAAAKIPVVVPVPVLDSDRRERRAPAEYAKAGVEIAFCTMGMRNEGSPESLRLGAVLAAATGLDRVAAFAAISTNPAKILGCEAEVGSLDVGRDADLVVFGGEPMNLAAPILAVFASGVPVGGEERRP